MADFDRLLAEVHTRGLKLILDFVPNHTSHQHPWFQEARRSRTDPRRDWYIWHDPAPDGGPPTPYYGDAIGMTDVAIPPERVQDPFEMNVPGIGVGRDPARTPMQWSAAPGAGFTTVEPWLPLAADHATVNVEAQQDDPP